MEVRSRTNDLLSIYVPSFFIFVGMGIVSPVLALYAKSFQVTIAVASLAVSIYAVGRFAMDIPSGMLADRFGRRPTMIAGTVILSLSSFLNATAPNFALFLLYRLLEGMGNSMWMTSRQTLMADMLKPEERGRILGYFYSISFLGQAAGPAIGGFIAEGYGLNSNFYFYSILGLVSLVLTIVSVKETEHGEKHERLSFPRDVTKRLFKNPGFVFAAFATLTAAIMTSGIRQVTIPLFASTIVGLNPGEIGLVLTSILAMNLILTIPMGYAIDLFGRKPVIVMSLTVSVLSCLLFPQASTFLLMSGVGLIMGVGTSGNIQAPMAMATDSSIDEPHGVSIGVFRLFTDVGSFIGPIILGLVADSAGIVMPFYVMAGILIAIDVVIFIFGHETLINKKKRIL